MWDTIAFISPYAVTFTVPLLITALGGLICERSGVVNIGLEGLMVIGSFACALSIAELHPWMGGAAVWAGLGAAMIAGTLFSLLHAFASITLNANQIISGTAVNMIAGSLTVYFSRLLTGGGNIQIPGGLPRFDVPGLSSFPVLGPLFFTQVYLTTPLVLLILFGCRFMISRTPFGLRLRACGEHPEAADASGVKVRRIRYIAVMFSGAFAALGGGIILVTYSGEFSGSVSGLGFLALAALIFGRWRPMGILGATFFFGFAGTAANVSQVLPALSDIPGVLLKTFPYLATLIALVFFSKSSRAPRAAGEPFG